MTEAEKEQIKLRAAYFNGIAIAVAIIAMIAPVVAIYQAVFTVTPYLVWAKLIASVVFLAFRMGVQYDHSREGDQTA